MNKFFVFLSFFTLAAWGCHAQSWNLKLDKDGIKVYTASVEESSFKSVMATYDLNASIDQLLAVLLDVNKHKEWVYSTKVSRLLKKNADNDIVFYAEVKTPWPLTNRDYVAHLVATSPSPGTVIIESHAEPNDLPVNKDKVRVEHSDSHWVITTTGNNMLHIVYTVRFDPAGSVPAWLTNMFLTDGPFETFKHLSERVHMPLYQNAHYDFIKR